mmetsp:Transcript_57739/g.137437  ORF Transcript_57739/g.137437 Transcript_57739/m.137437 type:complete len:290 (+) Transcript_57739:144-1013(+)
MRLSYSPSCNSLMVLTPSLRKSRFTLSWRLAIKSAAGPLSMAAPWDFESGAEGLPWLAAEASACAASEGCGIFIRIPPAKKKAPPDSVVPAKSGAHITDDAPKVTAIDIWLLLRTPPSAMTGTPASRAARATWYTALPCGRPTVIASPLEGAREPTRSPSAPASSKGLACFGVTTFPHTTSTVGYSLFTRFRKSNCLAASPWTASSTKASTPASTRAFTLAASEDFGVTAAATNNCLFGSFAARGNWSCFLRSVRLTTATNSPPSFTMGSFPFFEARNLSHASDNVIGS